MGKKYRRKVISGWSIMWIICAFDLPVSTKQEQREATRFRKILLDNGFVMKQFSIYIKPASSLMQAKNYTSVVMDFLPKNGHVLFYYITDRQMALSDEYKAQLEQKNDEIRREEERSLFDY